jgi:hypothetical protein
MRRNRAGGRSKVRETARQAGAAAGRLAGDRQVCRQAGTARDPRRPRRRPRAFAIRICRASGRPCPSSALPNPYPPILPPRIPTPPSCSRPSSHLLPSPLTPTHSCSTPGGRLGGGIPVALGPVRARRIAPACPPTRGRPSVDSV